MSLNSKSLDIGGSDSGIQTTSNTGSGEGLALPIVGTDAVFKSLVAGANITLTPSATEIEISASAGGISDGDKGDITVSSGATVWTIDNSAVSLPKMQNINTNTILGRSSAGVGVIEENSIGEGLTLSSNVLSTIGNTTFQYRFLQNTTVSDPGSGQFKINSTIYSAVTIMSIDIITYGGADISAGLSTLVIGDTITFQDMNDSGKIARYRISATPTNQTGWFEIPVSYLSSSGTLIGHNQICAVQFTTVGTAPALVQIQDLAVIDDDIIQRKGGTWTNRTPAQYKVDLALVKSDVGLGNVDNVQQQPLDSDLTAIAALSPSNDDIIQRKSGVWTNRTPTQLKTDLALVKADVGLSNVDNTSDAAKPVSTATQTALDGKEPLLPTKTGQSLKYLRVNAGETALEWSTVSGAGEANTSSNAVADSATQKGLAMAKVGVDLPFKVIQIGSSKLTIATDANNVTLDVDQSQLTLAQSQVTSLVTDLANKYSSTNRQSNIINSEIDASAAIVVTKIAFGTANQVVKTNSAGTALEHGLLANANIDAAADIAQSKISNLVSDLSSKEATANKGAANGYCPLDASSKTPIANLPTGTTSSDVCIGNDARLSDKRAPIIASEATNDIMYFNGTNWVRLATAAGFLKGGAAPAYSAIAQADVTNLVSDLAAKEATANKNAAGGYAGLDGSSKITGSQQTYGTASNTACQGNDARLSDNRTPTDNSVTDAKMSSTGDAMLVGIEFVIDGGGSEITTGIKGDLEIPFNCTIERVTLLADQTGSIVIDIWKDTYANFPPTVADTITASAKPTISSAVKSQDATLTGWTTAIAEGQTLRFNVDSVTTIQRVTLSLKVRKT